MHACRAHAEVFGRAALPAGRSVPDRAAAQVLCKLQCLSSGMHVVSPACTW